MVEMNIFLGTSASTGIGIGKAFVIPEQKQKLIPHFSVDSTTILNEWDRFVSAKEKVYLSKMAEKGFTDNVRIVREVNFLDDMIILCLGLMVKRVN